MTTASRPAPFGSWPSPVTARDRVAGAGVPSSPTCDGGRVHWLESRAESGARVVLCRREADGSTTDLSPSWMSVRSRVHEYGGAAYAARDGVVLAVDFETQRLWRLDGTEPAPLTPPAEDAAVRWAAPEVDVRRGVCFAVREDHTDGSVEPVNELVRLPLAGGPAEVVVPGRRRALPRPETDSSGDASLPDFVSDPTLSPDGQHLAWVQWSHPGMPWDAGELWLGRLTREGDLEDSWRVAGGSLGASASEPAWLSARRLAFLSDPDGFAVPHVVEAEPVSAAQALVPATHEHGLPQWRLGTRTTAALPGGRLATVRTVDGRSRISVHDGSEAHDLDLPVVAVGGLAPHPDGLVAEVGHATEGWQTVVVTLDPLRTEVVSRRGTVPDPAYVATPEAVSWTGHGGDTAHGFLHRPTHPTATTPEDELPPLLVVAHGGPTSSAGTVVPSSWTAYYTSRGIAVLDVDYGGSTGYGRAYRERLRGQWGVVDVEDVVLGARHLADQGVVDGARLGVMGGSAGGFVVLAALAFHDVFTAGISYFGVADPSLLAQETHKFESRYLDGLIGPWPAARATYDDRSPLHHADGIDAPLLLLQGLEDRVVPPSQTTAIADALRARGRDVEVVEFAGEGHGFRDPANIVRSAELELEFFGRVWGFAPDLGA